MRPDRPSMPGRPGAQGRRRCIRAAAAGALLCAAALAGPAWTATILGASNRAVTMATAPVELPLAPADGGPMADALAASRRLRLVILGLRADRGMREGVQDKCRSRSLASDIFN